MLKDIVRGAPDVIKRRVVPPDAVAAMRARIEEMEEDVEAVMEEEKVERELRKASMEEEKTRNIVEHEDEIQARPKKTWFQSKDEKRATREQNPASGRRLLEQGNGKMSRAAARGGGDEPDQGAGGTAISRSKVFTGKKEDKYAGMSRKKRRRAQDREMDELERQRDEALASHAHKGFDMFAEDDGKKASKRPKVLSQKAAKSAYRKGTLDLDANKNKKKDKKRKQRDKSTATRPKSKEGKSGGEGRGGEEGLQPEYSEWTLSPFVFVFVFRQETLLVAEKSNHESRNIQRRACIEHV